MARLSTDEIDHYRREGRLIPEHLHEERSDLTLNQRLAAGSFDEADAVDLELEPGQMSLLRGVDRSRRNDFETGHVRRALTPGPPST